MPQLIQTTTGTFVEAFIRRNMAPTDVDIADTQWQDFKKQFVQQQVTQGQLQTLPEHFHWRWSHKMRHYQGRSGYEFIGLECEDKLQGILLLDYTRQSHLPELAGAPLVYVDYLATAPWNLRELNDPPQFTGVGRALIGYAQDLSVEQGYAGRVGLHSLPQAETFYRERLRMLDLGPDNQYHGLHYFEIAQEDKTNENQ
jgi:hypothetical protein